MRRRLRITLWVCGAVLLLAAALVVAVLIAGNTAGGRVLLERATARLSDGHVRLTGLSGSFPAAIELEQLQLRDERGVWLTAQRISIRWSPLALLARHVKVADLKVARLEVERRPQSQPKQDSSSVSLPHIDVQRFSIDLLQLGPELAGTLATLTVQGTAHLRSLTDATGTVIAHRTDGQSGEYELSLRFDPASMDASLRLEEPAGGALGNLLQYPDLGAVSVVASLSGARSAEHLLVNARAGALRLRAQGGIDLPHESADLSYSLEAPAMAPRPGLSWQHLTLQGRWQGPLRTALANGHLQLDALRLPDGAGVAAVDATMSVERGVLAVHATADGVVLPGSQPRLLSDSNLKLDARVSLNDSTRPLQLQVQHRLFALQASGLAADPQSATFSVSLPDLGPFAALAGVQLRGRSQLRGTLKRSAAAIRLELDANSELANGASLLNGLLAGTSRLQLAATVNATTVALERLAFNGRTLTLAASGSAERGTDAAGGALKSLRARYDANVSNIAVLAPTLAGSAQLSGQIYGPATSLTATAQLTASASVRDSPRETVQANIDARGLPALASATLKARGRIAGAPLQLDASVQRAGDGTFRVQVPRSQWQSVRVEGDLTTAANLVPGHGVLSLRVEHLADLQPILGTSIAGSLSGSLALKPLNGHTAVQLQLEAQNVVAANVSANARLSAVGTTDAMSLQVSAQSPDVRGEPASLDGTAHLDLSTHELALQRAQARYHGQTLQLLAPARLSFGEGLSIRTLKLGLQHAVIELDGNISPALDLHMVARQIEPALINAFAPELLAQGTLEVDAQLAGTLAAPTGVVTLQASGLRLAGAAARDLRALDLRATAHLHGSYAQLDTQLSAGSASQLKLTGTAPLAADGQLNLRLNGRLDAALANPILEARGERAAGALTIDATVSGAARAPEIAGTVDLAHGDLRDYTQGAHLSDITAHLVGSQGTLRIASLTARAAPGQVSMSGTLGVLEPKLPVDLRLTARNAQPIASDVLTTNLDADLQAKGTLRERVDLSGVINLHRTTIGIPNGLPPEVAVLDVRRPGQAPPAPAEHRLVIGLDVQLHAPREILVQGRGLNAELGGDVRLRGTSDSPRVGGGFDLLRGTFALASTQLTFTSGRVSFNGAGLRNKIDPTLDFTAQTTVADATATLKITGFADAPQFELSSSPPLPQDEILARLLFGESASQLSALQVAQIGAALASLSGVGGGGLNPLAKVQKALGLDRLSVGGGSSSNTPGSGTQNSGASVTAGRYVSNRVFVGAKQSTTGFSQVQVDVDLSKHLKLQSRLGNGTATTQGTTPENDPGSSVGIVYQFEY